MAREVELMSLPNGLKIPKPPVWYKYNQLTAWKRYFTGRAELFAKARDKRWEPTDGRIYAAMDIECHDPYINDFGPGAIRDIGYILGVGIYCPQLGIDDYYRYDDPIIKRLFDDERVSLIFHNAVYDMDWLYNWKKSPVYHSFKCRIEDTMTRQALIDTYSPSLGLDFSCQMFGIEGKNKEETIDEWYAAHYEEICIKAKGQGEKKPSKKAVQNLKWVPSEVVGKYCKQDCKATYDLYMAQQPALEEEDLLRAYDIECRLYPWLMKTRSIGIRIDNVAREKLSEAVTKECEEYERDFKQKYGDVNINSNKQLQEMWRKYGLPFCYNKEGRPSFGYDQMLEFRNGGSQLEWRGKVIREEEYGEKVLGNYATGAYGEIEPGFQRLKRKVYQFTEEEAREKMELAHNIAVDILQIREYRKLLDTFVDGQFVDMQYKGRLYTCLYPSKRDGKGGTVTGRFSCLAVGTPVWTEEHGYIPIEQCVPGLHIMTHNGMLRPIKQVRFTGLKRVGRLGALICTADHKIWNGIEFIRADRLKEVLYCNEQELNLRQGMERGSNCNVSSRRQTYNKGNEYQNRILKKNDEEMFGYVLTSRCIRGGESFTLQSTMGDYARGWKSYVREDRSLTSQLQRRVRRWERLYDCEVKRKEMANPQSCNGSSYRNSRRAATQESSSTSYRRKPEKQFYRQSSSSDGCWARSIAQKVYCPRGWEPMGVLPVFDIEVDGVEHSFIAAGIPVHNSANPNLQQVPAHSEWGKQTRSIFIPETVESAKALGYNTFGCTRYLLGAFDYKQVEYRLFTHFAQGEEGKAAQKLYEEDPNLDYHEMGQKMMGWWYPDDEWANKEARHMMKRLSFGNLYGLKAKTFSEHFKWDLLKSHPNVKQEDLYYLAEDLQRQYKEKVPFIAVTNEAIMNVGRYRGYIKTLSGKRQRMPPDPEKGGDDAYKLINYLVQGSAGDVFKKGVCVDAYEAGVFDVLIPHLMVHDEMVFSIPDCKEGYEACVKLKQSMSAPYKLKVALGVDTEIGDDWGHCKGDVWEEFEKKWQ